MQDYQKECSNCDYGKYILVHSFWDCDYVNKIGVEPKILINGDCLTWKEKSK
jgi:hypothetical protein